MSKTLPGVQRKIFKTSNLWFNISLLYKTLLLVFPPCKANSHYLPPYIYGISLLLPISYTHTHTHIYIHISICTHISTYICTYIYTYMYIHIYIVTHTRIYIHIHVYICTYIRIVNKSQNEEEAFELRSQVEVIYHYWSVCL